MMAEADHRKPESGPWRNEILNAFRGHLAVYKVLLLALLLSLGLFELCRIEFYFLNRSLFSGISMLRLAEIALGGFRFDLSALLYINALFILMLVVPNPYHDRLWYRKMLTVTFLLTNGLALLMNIADSFYYPFTLRRTTKAIFDQFSNEPGFGPLIGHYLLEYWYGALLWLALCILMFIFYRRIMVNMPEGKGTTGYYLTGLIMLLLCMTLGVGGMRGGFSDDPPLAQINAAAYAKGPGEISLVLNTPFAFLTSVPPKFERVDFFRPEELRVNFDPVQNPSPNGAFRQVNVVIIILESFSQAYTGTCTPSTGDKPHISYTPFLDSLANHGKSYRYAKANGIRSVDAVPSIICSIPPVDDPYFLTAYATNHVNSLPSLLKKKGYYSAFFHGGNNGTMGFQAFAQLSGFDDYFGRNEYQHDEDYDGMWGIWDEPFLQFYAQKMSGFREPFFTTVFTVSSHDPYRVPDGYETRFPKGTMKMHQVISYTDYSLRKFFATASTMPWFSNTLFVLVADHAYAWNDFSIPLIFYKAGEHWTECADEIIQQTDILPTVLGYLNYDKPFVAFGRDAFRKDTEPFAFHYIDNSYRMFSGTTC